MLFGLVFFGVIITTKTLALPFSLKSSDMTHTRIAASRLSAE
jgi:hypothetical protein